MNNLINLVRNRRIVLFAILLVFCLYSTYLFLTSGQRGYDTVLADLARRFVEGKISLSIYNLPPRDIANYYNNFYLYFGPLASLLLMPFVFLFGERVPQVGIGVGSMIISFAAVYLISKRFKFTSIDSLWLGLFFVFSTVMFSSSVINITAYQVEALGVPFILLGIWAYLTKKNPLLIGLFFGFAIMTRFTLMLAMAFFFVELLQKRLSLKHFVLILIPVIVSVLILGAYNQRRFHSFTETGYHYNIATDDFPISENLKYGEISIRHIPANLYSFLIMAPEPLLQDKNGGFFLRFPYMKINPWGVAIWFTSPLFILLITRFKKGTYTLSAAVAAFFLSLPVFLWYSIGFAQVGYRYALDFLPFLFLLLVPCLSPRLTRTAIVLIILGVLFNCIYSDSVWELYPVFNMYE